jgi:4-amino-4-deoxy-L-arabinose transferase-like glycosyltransferase
MMSDSSVIELTKGTSREPKMVEESTGDHYQNLAATRRLDWLLVALLGLAIQAIWLWLLTQPTYMDAFYYTTNGQQIANGQGFTEMIVWQYLDNPEGLPTPSHTYWMPLPSILAAAGYLIIDDFSGAQLIFWLLGGLLPLLAYEISHQLGGPRWQRWVTAIFVAIGGFYAPFLIQPSTFAPFAWAGGLCLLALGLASVPGNHSDSNSSAADSRNDRRHFIWWLVAGLAAGLAHLTRADGLLLFLVGIIIWILAMRERHSIRNSFFWLMLFITGYLLIMGWWFFRNWLVIGSPLSSAGTQSIFLTTYDDLFAFGRTISFEEFINWGWANILRSRLDALWTATQTMIAVPGLIFLVPFIIIAYLRFIRQRFTRLLLLPATIFALATMIILVVLFSFPAMRGSLFHSSIALWPWTMALAVAGIGYSVDWAAARLPHWQPERAKRLFSVLFIVIGLVLTIAVANGKLTPLDDPETIEALRHDLPDSAVVMYGSPPAFYYYTGIPSVSVPNEPPEILLEAVDQYEATHLVLDENHPLPLNDLYYGLLEHPRLILEKTIGPIQLYRILEATP